MTEQKPRRPRSRKADAITPTGAGEPLPPRPGVVNVTAADQDDAADVWDSEMPSFAGLLDAQVVE